MIGTGPGEINSCASVSWWALDHWIGVKPQRRYLFDLIGAMCHGEAGGWRQEGGVWKIQPPFWSSKLGQNVAFFFSRRSGSSSASPSPLLRFSGLMHLFINAFININISVCVCVSPSRPLFLNSSKEWGLPSSSSSSSSWLNSLIMPYLGLPGSFRMGCLDPDIPHSFVSTSSLAWAKWWDDWLDFPVNDMQTHMQHLISSLLQLMTWKLSHLIRFHVAIHSINEPNMNRTWIQPMVMFRHEWRSSSCSTHCIEASSANKPWPTSRSELFQQSSFCIFSNNGAGCPPSVRHVSGAPRVLQLRSTLNPTG